MHSTAASVIAVPFAAGAAHADPTFDTFSPTTSDYSSSITFSLGGLSSQGPLAWPFTALAGGNVTHFRTAAFTTTPIGSNPAPMTFSIYTDAGGQPGALLGQWSGAAPATRASFPQHPVPWELDVVGPALTAGQTYFFAMSLPAPAPGWIGSTPSDRGLPSVGAWRFTGGAWTATSPGSSPAFPLTAPPAPAPAAAPALLGIPLLGRRRR